MYTETADNALRRCLLHSVYTVWKAVLYSEISSMGHKVKVSRNKGGGGEGGMKPSWMGMIDKL